MVIIEGCDGVGKSTLAKRLNKLLNFFYFKDSYHEDGLKRYLNLTTTLSPFTIADRFHLGEVVYPIIKNDGRKALLEHEQHMIERCLQSQPHLLIYCETTVDNIEKAFKVRGEDFITVEQIPAVLQAYNMSFERSILTKIKVDPRESYFGHSLKIILSEYSKKLNRYWRALKFQSTGLNDHPKLMLVGDNYSSGREVNVNTFTSRSFHNHMHSAQFLHKALSISKNKSVYITNANKTRDQFNNISLLEDEVRFVQPAEIIALGKNARELLVKTGFDHTVINHPQHEKRFNHKNIITYSNNFKS